MNNEKVFTFWLFDWDVTPVYEIRRFYPRYLRCTIDRECLTLFLPDQPIAIPLTQITQSERYQFLQNLFAGAAVNLRLQLSESLKIQGSRFTRSELYLAPVDVLSEIPRRSYYEIDDMLTLIVTLQQGALPTIHPNPYYRELARRNRLKEFLDEKWNANVAPNVYTKVYTAPRMIITLLVVIGALWLLLMGIVALVFNLLN